MNNLFITYLLNHPILKWDPYKDTIAYRVYRGLTATALEKLADTSLLQYYDESKETDLFEKMDRVTYYYQIASINAKGEETFITNPQFYEFSELNYPIKGALLEIARRNILSVNNFIWDKIDLYLKKGAGEVCDCYDPYRRDTESAFECKKCYGTKFVGGFDKIPMKVKLRNGPKNILESQFGHKVEQTKEAWTVAYPLINSGDWFRCRSEVYEVDSVTRKEEGGIILHQKMIIKLLPSTDAYYQIF